jgi:hypothetical protein
LLSEFVQLLLQGGLDLFGLAHLGTDSADGSVQAGADNDAAGLEEREKKLKNHSYSGKKQVVHFSPRHDLNLKYNFLFFCLFHEE